GREGVKLWGAGQKYWRDSRGSFVPKEGLNSHTTRLWVYRLWIVQAGAALDRWLSRLSSTRLFHSLLDEGRNAPVSPMILSARSSLTSHTRSISLFKRYSLASGSYSISTPVRYSFN